MAITFYPGNLQWLGLAKEAVYGTAMAAPTVWVPVDSPKWSPKQTTLTDQNLRGFMGKDYGQQNGSRFDEVSYKTYIYADSVMTHFKAILGGTDSVTGTADPVTHKMSLSNGTGTDGAQPPSFTVFLMMTNGKTKAIPGCVLGALKFSGKANELPSLDVTWTGLLGVDITPPVNTPTTSAPMPPSTLAITVAAANLGKYTDVSLDYKRDIAPILTLNGTGSPAAIYAGALQVSGTLNAVYQGFGDTDLANLLTNGQPTLTVAITPAGDTTHPFTQTLSKINYDSADPSGSSSGWMTIASNFKAIMNSVDATDGKMSPCSATLVNSAITPL